MNAASIVGVIECRTVGPRNADIIHLLRWARKEVPMTDKEQQQAERASMLGVIERLAGELALAEEPARFIAALEGDDEASPRA
jgi:hypothetical protein